MAKNAEKLRPRKSSHKEQEGVLSKETASAKALGQGDLRNPTESREPEHKEEVGGEYSIGWFVEHECCPSGDGSQRTASRRAGSFHKAGSESPAWLEDQDASISGTVSADFSFCSSLDASAEGFDPSAHRSSAQMDLLLNFS